MYKKSATWQFLSLALIAGLLVVPFNGIVFAQELRPEPVSPFGADPSTEGEVLGKITANAVEAALSGGSGSIFVDAADWLIAQELPGGCYPWTMGGTTCSTNVQGPIGRGLVQAYLKTLNPAYLEKAVAVGEWFTTEPYPSKYTDGDYRFSTHDALFLEELSQVSGDSKYADFVQTYFWDKFTSGTYGEANDMDAADFGAAVVASRASGGIVELSPWDLSATAIAAYVAGETTHMNALMGAILDGLEATTTADNTYDITGLAGAVWAAAITGTDLIPTAGRYFDAGYDSTADLAAFLASLQRGTDGSWLVSTISDPEDITNEDTQNSAFAVLALFEFDSDLYISEIIRGVGFLRSMQQSDGQILAYPTASATTSGGVEVHAEAISALVTTDAQIWIDPADSSIKNDNADTTTLTVNISNAYNLYGYQFVLTYDISALEATAAAFDDTFFSGTASSVPGWNATIVPGEGKIYFARTSINPAEALSGDGILATVTFRSTSGASAGAYNIAFEQTKLSTRDGEPLPSSTQLATINVYSVGNLSGFVDLQGRFTDESGGEVTILGSLGYSDSMTIVNTNGTWSFTGIPIDSYQVNIEMGRYLDAQKDSVSVTDGSTTTLNKVKLLGGDANHDDVVDISDASIIGNEFGKSGGDISDPDADINNDSTVDILDLALMGGNYGKTSPVSWP